MEEGYDRIEAATYAWSSTAAPMLTGTIVTIAGFLPVGFAASTAGEYAGNIFWVVTFSLLISWIVAVTFTPYIWRQAPARHQEGRGRPRRHLRHEELRAPAAGRTASRSTTSGWRRQASPWLRGGRGGHGQGRAAVLPELGTTRTHRRGDPAGRLGLRNHRGQREEGRGGGTRPAGGQGDHELHRPGHATLRPVLRSGASGPRLRADRRPDRRRPGRDALRGSRSALVDEEALPRGAGARLQIVFGPPVRFPVASGWSAPTSTSSAASRPRLPERWRPTRTCGWSTSTGATRRRPCT